MLDFQQNWALALFGVAQANAVRVLNLVCALGVTLHVLLRKRNVEAATGWIGLAWVAPVIGALLYFMLGINRVRRRAQRLRETRAPRAQAALPARDGRDGHLAALDHAVHRITRRPLEQGNALIAFQNGDEAYPPMIDAIAAARVSVALSSYILRDDEAGGPFIDALIAAAGRGVAVRVLIDGIGSGYFHSRAYNRLARGGVPVARFMHSLLPWRMPFLNLRTHKKVLVVDGRNAFTGGMNIGRENLLALRPRHPVRDTHFAVQGPVVGQLVQAFVRDWLFVTGEELGGPAWMPEPRPAGEAAARVATSGPDQDLEKIEYVVLEAIACAQRSVRIVTPYFLPEETLVTSLALAAVRGVRVEIVIPQKGNHIVVDWATRAHVGPLLAAGCHLWRNPPPFDHSKIMVVDGAWSLIGSANWDMRSFRLNFELNMEVHDEAFARRLEALVEARKGSRITANDLAARALPIRLRDAAVRLMLPYI